MTNYRFTKKLEQRQSTAKEQRNADQQLYKRQSYNPTCKLVQYLGGLKDECSQEEVVLFALYINCNHLTIQKPPPPLSKTNTSRA
eukprot:5781097-Amphidinium_carterae.1